MRMFYLYRQPIDPNKSRQEPDAVGGGIEFGEYGRGQVAIAWAYAYGGGISIYSSLPSALEATKLRFQGEILACWASDSAWSPEEALREANLHNLHLAKIMEQGPMKPIDWDKEG